ncbi:hypothetical protein [Bradyrhizobium sp. 2S1]|uniref:hypothetical protein n=1 Tax=Bradyrhizobium sp. 2S1 TaxID=1404429 RepID=UPI00140A7C04|nr:hypothetical protein [Bradyrhizobium sp. 2S1]MCK7671052.1 hypothetical protein [Bradyrhizobium sp. 2S1]
MRQHLDARHAKRIAFAENAIELGKSAFTDAEGKDIGAAPPQLLRGTARVLNEILRIGYVDVGGIPPLRAALFDGRERCRS